MRIREVAVNVLGASVPRSAAGVPRRGRGE
jgi:hypothetical protein